ncbi:hypothetical protein [Novosphingobium sp. 9U]|uniref:hypothetical protein n=1 Tax=Novosphingobium sp. 9U TaxID=2653158 RepID=UPI001F2CBD84|nr:hypothetical protein [Novosphingobium sp. 9U]
MAVEFEAAAGPRPGASFTTLKPRCAAGRPDEIVVCAGDPERNRLRPLPDTPGLVLPRAEMQVSGNASVDLHVESAQISGVPSNRAMVSLKIGL